MFKTSRVGWVPTRQDPSCNSGFPPIRLRSGQALRGNDSRRSGGRLGGLSAASRTTPPPNRGNMHDLIGKLRKCKLGLSGKTLCGRQLHFFSTFFFLLARQEVIDGYTLRIVEFVFTMRGQDALATRGRDSRDTMDGILAHRVGIRIFLLLPVFMSGEGSGAYYAGVFAERGEAYLDLVLLLDRPDVLVEEMPDAAQQQIAGGDHSAVSYTHLTLPTN